MDSVSESVYVNELKPWLPEKVIDCHVHIGLPEHCGPILRERISILWALEVANSFSWQEMKDTFGLLMPDQDVRPLAFGWPYQEVDVERNNDYVLQGVRDTENRALALTVTKPEWSPDHVDALLDEGFIGIKPYPDFAPGGYGDVSIYDFLPRSHLEVVNRHGGVIIVHLPRKGRIADEDNIRELKEIRQQYPSIKLIVAHIGRAFCLPTAKSGLPQFADDPGIYFDTAANLNAEVFQYALETIGPDRVLYGSDLPIMLMKGIREHVGDTYINYTDGNYSWNTNRRSSEEESGYTYYLYEELLAIMRAVERAGMGSDAVRKIMYSNSAKLLEVQRT